MPSTPFLGLDRRVVLESGGAWAREEAWSRPSPTAHAALPRARARPRHKAQLRARNREYGGVDEWIEGRVCFEMGTRPTPADWPDPRVVPRFQQSRVRL